METFISQLKKIQDKFLNYAKKNSKKVDMNSLEINCFKYGLIMRIEALDTNGDLITFRQEIFQNGKKLDPFYIDKIL